MGFYANFERLCIKIGGQLVTICNQLPKSKKPVLAHGLCEICSEYRYP
jgi:hypothetical protein